ncbi:hypothetical protein CBI38_28200 [Rhodococcus oxybenzonivorans]|uniref:Uncharacterized protein n=1 Tax=Rhodococcus oxybenzonivorans TaxID=1990687 RepID=A0A2S2C1X7_9NOCA|nr:MULTISPECIES: hypothetical protein [Rhodococcus]AWK74870.1 hypothetical protein CBI38_28200 [Rhodococcus oxybenzonivorans]QTJ67291.1 hypothetical protein HYG77_18055 [Rhodococcus sp. ZPP]
MDHTRNTLGALRKSLLDSVAPAVDPADPLASEQLPLVADYLEFLGTRIYRIHERSRFELAEYLRMAEGVLTHLSATATPTGDLAKRLDVARAAHGAASTGTTELIEQGAALAAAVSTVAQDETLPDEVRQTLGRWVVESSRGLLAFQRSWYAPFGFESDRDRLRSIDDFLAGRSCADA